MINIKIPSPSISIITALIEKNHLNKEEVVDDYMAIVSNTLHYVGGSRLSYQNELLSDYAITADVDINTLPSYLDIIETYGDIGIEDELIKRISKANSKFGSSCPLANAAALKKPIRSWSPRWITVYIWVLLCCEHSKDTFCTDEITSTALFLELSGISVE